MLFTDVIRTKRDGGTLSAEQIRVFVDGLSDGSLPAEQVSALAMAIFLNSMSFDEAAQLTDAMSASGKVLDWGTLELGGPVVDKHSTGGVGDKVSFLLAPIAAACGCFVPMISGRGLGHTGGTTDKAESIPLITASILSKKIAAGTDAMVMDVKTGSGAFMPTFDKSIQLAESLIGTSARVGLKTTALITDMDEVLGTTAGNALEIEESMAFLRNEFREPRLNEVVLALCAEMLVSTGIEPDRERALERCEIAVTSGRGAEVFDAMCAALGGPNNFVANSGKHLPTAPVTVPVLADGYLAAVDVRAVGNAIIELGGGRRRVGDTLDLSVGLSDVAPIGTRLDKERPLAVIHAANPEDAARAAERLLSACTVGEESPAERPVIYRLLTGQD